MIILGYVLSSFIYWSATAYATENTLWRRRSRCDDCGSILQWWQLIPIVSFCALRGRSVCCQQPLKWVYPLSELVVVAVLVPIGFDMSVSAIVQGSVYLVLIWLSFVDWQSYHVPLPMVIFLALLLVSLHGTAVIAVFVINGAVCLLLWLSANRAIGSGDICLFLALGWGVPPLQFIWLIGLAAALGLVWTMLKRQRQPIPFVPFISMAYFIMTGGVFDGGFAS